MIKRNNKRSIDVAPARRAVLRLRSIKYKKAAGC